MQASIYNSLMMSRFIIARERSLGCYHRQEFDADSCYEYKNKICYEYTR
jgi:hypothetical protein